MAPRRFRVDIRQAGRLLLTVWLGLLAVNILFYAALVRPRAQAYRDLSSDSEPRIRALQRREADVRAREEYLAALNRAQSEIDRLRRDILSTRDRRMIETQLEVERLVRQFNTEYKQVQYDNEALADEGLDRFEMVVPLEGSYSNLRKFLQAVESSDKFLVIEEVALQTGQEGGVHLRLNVTLSTYFDDPALREVMLSRRARAARGGA